MLNKMIWMSVILALNACYDPPKPEKMTDVSRSEPEGAFYRYRPGSIQNDYVTLELGGVRSRKIVLSISSCSAAAARVTRGEADVVLFDSVFSAKSPSEQNQLQESEIGNVVLSIRSLGSELSPSNEKQLKQQGYTVIRCET